MKAMIGTMIGTIQRESRLNIEAVEGGYVVATDERHIDGSYTSGRSIVTNEDALLSFVRGWVARYRAESAPTEKDA